MSPSATPPAAPAPVEWADPSRRDAFEAWLAPIARRQGLEPSSLRLASADASFRRYFRIDRAAPTPAGASSLIVMDAPPAQEDVRPFVHVAGLLQRAGLTVPTVVEQDVERGFLLLDDLGDRLLLAALQASEAAGDAARSHALMVQCLDTLVTQQAQAAAQDLPPYDEALLRRELALFPEWCVRRDRQIDWTPTQTGHWERACDRLVASALAQPTVFVHRDFMPRNLMLAEPAGIGLLDFQDAVRGPIAYDVASLLRDAFLSWDEEREIDWAVRYWERARKAGLPVDPDFGEFWRQLEWMGLQRHLKVLGIFCRLKHRDGKPRYHADLPRFFGYAHKVAARYNGLGPLAALLEQAAGTERREGYTF